VTLLKGLAIICLDGITWEYINNSKTPFIDSLGKTGTSTICQTMVPTVTNVNNASIITCSFPEKHGITSNWYYDRGTGKEVFMDSNHFLKCNTFLENEAKKGKKVILLTVKDKLRRLLQTKEVYSYSVEKPTAEIVDKTGSVPGIYELAASPWLLRAAYEEISERKWDIVYVSTTDFIPHKYAPKHRLAREYMSRIDEGLEYIHNHGYEMGIVSDHGMNHKSTNFDPVTYLKEYGVNSKIVASIKDEHIIHHMNLGGSAYLYTNLPEKAKMILSDCEGVEAIYSREEAAKKYRLMPARIGDLLILADKKYTFGRNKDTTYRKIDIRSHGSLHEREVPFITSRKIQIEKELYNKDIIPYLIKMNINH
jgi:phosphonoacetate hydrolase